MSLAWSPQNLAKSYVGLQACAIVTAVMLSKVFFFHVFPFLSPFVKGVTNPQFSTGYNTGEGCGTNLKIEILKDIYTHIAASIEL